MAFDRAGLSNFTREITVASQGLTGQAASRHLAAVARRHVVEVERQQSARSGGIVPDHIMVVDGRTGAAPETVRPEGAILIRWHYLTEAVIRVVDYLEVNGPERSGEWKRSLTTYVDDTPVSRSAALPAGAQEAVVVARAEYSRRLEVGKDEKGGPFVVQVPQHFMEQAAIALRRVLRPLGWQPRIRFIQTASSRAAARRARARGDRAAARAAMSYPAIVITPQRGAGL